MNGPEHDGDNPVVRPVQHGTKPDIVSVSVI